MDEPPSLSSAEGGSRIPRRRLALERPMHRGRESGLVPGHGKQRAARWTSRPLPSGALPSPQVLLYGKEAQPWPGVCSR
jgi:hypothetical protein